MDRMEATEESLVMRGSRRSLPQCSRVNKLKPLGHPYERHEVPYAHSLYSLLVSTQYHLETEQPLHNQESLRHRAPRQVNFGVEQ